jgi:hypothetical protein
MQRPRRLEAALAPQQLVQVQAFDVGHRQVQATVLLPECQDRNDMRMVEAGSDLRLPHESLPEALVLGQLRREELQCDVTSGFPALG